MHYQKPTASSLQKVKVKVNTSSEAPQLPNRQPQSTLQIPRATSGIHDAHRSPIAQSLDHSSSSVSPLQKGEVKVKTSSQAPRLPETRLQLTLQIPRVASGIRDAHQSPIAYSLNQSSSSVLTTPRQERLDPNSLSPNQPYNAPNRRPNNRRRHNPLVPRTHGTVHPTNMSLPNSVEQVPKKERYYSKLSVEDKEALSRGEENHNLKKWSFKDFVIHQETRKELIPRVMNKVDQTNALAGIERDKQHGQLALSNMTDSFVGQAEEEPTYTGRQYGSQSAYDLRSLNASASQLPLSPPSPPSPVLDPLRTHQSSHTRAVSSGDYFSHQPGRRTAHHTRRPSPLASSPKPHSDASTSSRVRSPLSQELQFRHNPEVTFDSFLAPHKAGKGETHRESENAQKSKGSPDDSPKPTRLSRLSKMPSMPLLRKRSEDE